MPKSPSTIAQTTTTPPTVTKAALLLLLTILDTTWRAFVPTIGGTILGVTIDNMTHHAPLFTIISIIIGFTVAIVLIVSQIRQVRDSR